MTKLEESSVKLDLGSDRISKNEEDEEDEEEEESEIEEEEDQESNDEEEEEEEGDENNDVVDLDFDINNLEAVNTGENINVDTRAETTDKNNVEANVIKGKLKLYLIILKKLHLFIFLLFLTKLSIAFYLNIILFIKNLDDQIPKKQGNSTTINNAVAKKNKNKVKAVSNTNNNNNNNNKHNKLTNNQKTVFTKIAEDLFNKFTDKSYQNKKSSCFDLIINDTYLNRVNEKGDKESTAKFNNFSLRNKEFREKKKAKLQEKIEKNNAEIDLACTHIPNGKIHQGEDLRKPEEFLNDHLKYYNTRDLNIQQQKENQINTTNSLMKESPEISKKSKRLAKKKRAKNPEGEGKVVHDRLFTEKLSKLKTHLVKEKEEKLTETQKLLKYGSNKKKEQPKKTQEEINTLVIKLHTDAENRKKTKEDFFSSSSNKNELTTVSSQKLVLENYINSFELALLNLFNKKEDILMNFEEFKALITNLGFLKLDTTDKVNLEENESVKKDNSLLMNAWKILTNNTENKEEEEKVDSNQVLLFTCAIQGLYKGEKKDTENEVENDEKNRNDNNANSNLNSPNKKKCVNGKNDISPKKSPFKMPNRFGTTAEHHRYASSLGNTFGIGHLLSTPTNKNESLSSPLKQNINVLKKIMPDFDFDKYSFDEKTAQNIRSTFANWNLAKSEFCSLNKRKNRKNNVSNLQQTFFNTVKASDKLRRSAENFRRRIFEEAENTNLSMKQDETTNKDNFVKKKLKLEEVYNILKIKKENDLIKQREEKEAEQLKHCTFQPNLGKRNHDVVDQDAILKLYKHGVEKVRKAKNSQTELKDDFENCSFKPSVNKFNEKIFLENPLVHDKNVKKEVERFERARLEKKILELKKKKGVNNLKQLKNLELLLKGEDFKPWGFEVEKKTFKDTFTNYNSENNFNSKSNRIRSRSLINSHDSKRLLKFFRL